MMWRLTLVDEFEDNNTSADISCRAERRPMDGCVGGVGGTAVKDSLVSRLPCRGLVVVAAPKWIGLTAFVGRRECKLCILRRIRQTTLERPIRFNAPGAASYVEIHGRPLSELR